MKQYKVEGRTEGLETCRQEMVERTSEEDVKEQTEGEKKQKWKQTFDIFINHPYRYQRRGGGTLWGGQQTKETPQKIHK